MSCDRYHDALTDLAAGGPATARLETHLVSCEGCREELAALRRALALADAEMARLVGAEPSPGLAARIRETARESEVAPAWPLGWMWPVAAASAVLLVALAAWMIRAPSPERVAVEGRPAATPGERRPPVEGRRTSEAPERGRTSERLEGAATSPRPRTVAPAPETAALRQRRGSTRAVPAAPEVLVPRGEAEALVRFAAIVHRDRQAPAAFLEAGQPSPDLAEPAALVIKPLEIVPLDPAESSGTD